MAFLHIKKSLKDYDCSLECVRHYALVNDLKIRDLTHLVVSKISSSQLQILLKQKINQITLFYIPLHADFPYEIEQQPTLSELRTNSPTVLLCLGSIIRRVPISSLTGQMLHTMEHNSKRCCMCWDEIQITTEAGLNNACSGCNVIWCTPCHSKFEGNVNAHYFSFS